ncbi:hypothetical protein FA13DRAFT_1729669 [Coprinellus micaceus]|uniref:Nuclear pore complex protein NUP96 C-terminal domain-containing protein n=1 Tax=Coprinellus micaceus TaxID=71717 RepID=A0A4Y7TJQ8_COPMI|nr:hypothetical protein FA13DRAFT_1729669 [Coprinellus micaceus]
MARFRAFESDSSSDDEPETQNMRAEKQSTSRQHEEQDEESDDQPRQDEEGESDSDGSSSAMLEDELINGWRENSSRPRKALTQDENGDFQVTGDDYSDEEYVHGASDSSSTPSSPAAEPRPTSNIIPWARHVGVDAQKMHVMQTSLFRMPEEAAALKALNNQPPKGKTVAGLKVHRKHSRDSETGDGLRGDSRERASFAHDIEPALIRPSRKYARVDVASSISKDKEGAYVDAGLAFGRSFRVGWGPGGKLAHSGAICGLSASSPSSSNSSTITLTQTPFPAVQPHLSTVHDPDSEDPSPNAISEKLLEHHLSHTPITKSSTGIPVATPPFPQHPSKLCLLPALFRLGSALFDPIDLNLASGRRLGSSSITAATLITPDVRNRALSQWLEHVVKPTVEGDIRAKAAGPLSGNYTAADTVFTQLTGHQVEHACTVAMDAGYLKLATLVCQAGGERNLKIWADEKLAPPSNGGSSIGPGPNGLISRGVWKVYRLLTEMTSWVEEVCAGLDWKRVFGLCLWYGLGVDAAVADVVKLYDGLIKRYTTSTSSTLVARPIPRWQIDKQQGRSSSSSFQQSNGIFTGAQRAAASTLLSSPSNGNQKQYEDPLFSLIRLHSDPALSLSQVLSPLSFGPDERWGGVGMCWHLHIILSRSMRIRDFIDRAPVSSARRINGGAQESNIDDDELESVPSQVELGPSHTANLLTSGYAFELEGWGMIQEAAFVLLHLEDTEGRKKALKDLLARSAPKMDDWMVRGLVGSLKIPMTWVQEAKAMHALDQGDILGAYELYLSAQLWNAAHDLAVLELAPDAILRRDIELLRELFEPFDLDGRRDQVNGWFVRGKTFVDYVHILTRLPEVQEQLREERENHVAIQPPSGEASASEELDDLTRRIPKVIALLPDVLHRPRAVDDRHAAAIEEMTQALMGAMGKAKPNMLLKQPLLGFMEPSTKLSLIRGKSYAGFLQRLTVA